MRLRINLVMIKEKCVKEGAKIDSGYLMLGMKDVFVFLKII